MAPQDWTSILVPAVCVNGALPRFASSVVCQNALQVLANRCQAFRVGSAFSIFVFKSGIG